MKLTNEHNCQLFTDLDQLKDNDTSIRTNIERVWFFFYKDMHLAVFVWEMVGKIIERINMQEQI